MYPLVNNMAMEYPYKIIHLQFGSIFQPAMLFYRSVDIANSLNNLFAVEQVLKYHQMSLPVPEFCPESWILFSRHVLTIFNYSTTRSFQKDSLWPLPFLIENPPKDNIIININNNNNNNNNNINNNIHQHQQQQHPSTSTTNNNHNHPETHLVHDTTVPAPLTFRYSSKFSEFVGVLNNASKWVV